MAGWTGTYQSVRTAPTARRPARCSAASSLPRPTVARRGTTSCICPETLRRLDEPGDLDPVSARMLGSIQRAIGAGEQALGRVDRGRQRPAYGNAHADGQSLAPGLRLRDEDPNPLGRLAQAFIVRGLDKDRELLASPSRDDVAGPHRALQSGPDSLQYGVADGVPVPIVDLLEMVDVHDEQTEVPAVAAEVLEAAGKGRIEHSPVRQPCQVVGE